MLEVYSSLGTWKSMGQKIHGQFGNPVYLRLADRAKFPKSPTAQDIVNM